MDIRMTQTVLSKLAFLAILGCAQAIAKDIPIVESLSISVSSEKAVVEFPFKITNVSPDDFVSEKGAVYSGGPEIKKGENVLEVSSQTAGRIKTIIWGYEHPIFLELNFEKGGEKYYKFTDPIGKNEDIKELESNSHEDVISDLIISAYNEKLPKGYSSKSKKIGGKSGGLFWEMQVEYVGNEYSVQSWKITNQGKEDVELYEEMFASEKNKIYGISIEAPRLKTNEATRVFIVKKAG